MKAKGGCEDVIEEDSIGVHLSSDSGKVLEPRIHLLHLLSSHTHVLPPVEPGVELQVDSGSKELSEVGLQYLLEGVVYGLCDVAGIAAVVWAQPNVISLH